MVESWVLRNPEDCKHLKGHEAIPEAGRFPKIISLQLLVSEKAEVELLQVDADLKVEIEAQFIMIS